MNKRYLRRLDLARRYSCTDRNIDLMVRDGRLPQPTLQLGRFPLWAEDEIEAADLEAAVALRASRKPVTAADSSDEQAHP
jgi:predicted DNA-binding transcriptional regulator AlpA